MKRRAGIALFAMGQWHHNFSDPEEKKHRILYLGVMPELTIWMLDARGLNSLRVNVHKCRRIATPSSICSLALEATCPQKHKSHKRSRYRGTLSDFNFEAGQAQG